MFHSSNIYSKSLYNLVFCIVFDQANCIQGMPMTKQESLTPSSAQHALESLLYNVLVQVDP